MYMNWAQMRYELFFFCTLSPTRFVRNEYILRAKIKRKWRTKIQNDRSNVSDVLSPYDVNILVRYGVSPVGKWNVYSYRTVQELVFFFFFLLKPRAWFAKGDLHFNKAIRKIK